MPVAQPDRVFGYEPKGQGFESLTARHNKVSFVSSAEEALLFHFISENTAEETVWAEL